MAVRLPFRLFVVLGFLGTLACPDPLGGRYPGSDLVPAEREEHANYLKIRRLLGEKVQSPRRAAELYPLVSKVCQEAADREQFLESVAWSTGYATEEAAEPERLALDVLEHVSSSCARSHPEAGLGLLDAAEPHIRFDRRRLFVLKARLAAVLGRWEAAEAAAEQAMELGSVHAIALLANLKARMARESGSGGYRSGMLDEAIETTDVEPGPKWQAIDLAAVLSTRARLLNERAFWEPPMKRAETLRQAHEVFARLSVAPFLAATRRSALDPLCFDAPEFPARMAACETGARDFGMLGAARLTSKSRPLVLPDTADPVRAARLTDAKTRASQLKRSALAVLVMRGDETELLEWARPTVRWLRALPEAQWLVLDRTSSPRSTALMTRVLELSDIRVKTRLELGTRPRAVPCVAAALYDRELPAGCPLDAETQKLVSSLPEPHMAFFVGRDLDAELQDFQMYQLPVVLFSLRRSQTAENAPWMKSLSDVWWWVDPATGHLRDGTETP